MTVIECLRNWFREYEGLSGRFSVDFLDDKAGTHSIDTIPCEEVLKRYLDGSTQKQFQFAVSSRRFYEQNIAQNLENLQFFEDLTAWVEHKSRAHELPLMDNNRKALKIVVTSNAYPFIIAEDGTARYQLQMRLEYFQKGEK